MSESLLCQPFVGVMQAEPIAEIRHRKQRKESEILEDITEKLQVMQLATRNWDPGILRFACTDRICGYLTLVRGLLMYALLQRLVSSAVHKDGSVALADPLQDFYLWRSKLISAFARFTKREMVLQGIHKSEDLCPLNILASKLEYMTWDPGVHSPILAVLMEVSMVATRYACDRASCLPRVPRKNGCYIMLRLRHEQAIAWGKECFAGAVV